MVYAAMQLSNPDCRAAIVWLRALGGMSGEGQDYTHCSLDVVAWYPSLPLDGHRVRGGKRRAVQKGEAFLSLSVSARSQEFQYPQNQSL